MPLSDFQGDPTRLPSRPPCLNSPRDLPPSSSSISVAPTNVDSDWYRQGSTIGYALLRHWGTLNKPAFSTTESTP